MMHWMTSGDVKIGSFYFEEGGLLEGEFKCCMPGCGSFMKYKNCTKAGWAKCGYHNELMAHYPDHDKSYYYNYGYVIQ